MMEDIGAVETPEAHRPARCLRARHDFRPALDTQGVWRTILLMWRLRFDYWRGVPAPN